MGKDNEVTTGKWLLEHRKAIHQRIVRQCTTKHNVGTLPQNVYEKELLIKEKETLNYLKSENVFDSDQQTRDLGQEEDEDLKSKPSGPKGLNKVYRNATM